MGEQDRRTRYETAEGALKESEANYVALIDDLPELICRSLPDLTRTYVNEGYCRYFGKSREELIGRSFLDLLPEEDHVPLKEHLASLTPENPIDTFEHRVWRHDGEVRWQQWTNRAIYDKEGNFMEFQSVGRDITERKEAEEALAESEEQFRGAFEYAPIGMALVDLDNRYFKVNRVFLEMLGYEEGEIIGKTSWELTHQEDVAESKRRTSRMVKVGGLDREDLEKRYVRKDGGVVWVLSHVSLVQGSQGEPGHFVGHYQDVTDRKSLEGRLEHQALHDPLTGLPNRVMFMERLRRALERAENRGASPALRRSCAGNTRNAG